MTAAAVPVGQSIGFRRGLAAVLVGGAAVRAVYLWGQLRADPWFAQPVLDGAYYVLWAESLASGGGWPLGAYYHAPLYAWLLAALVALVGTRFLVVYAVQQLLSLATAALIGWHGRHVVGEAAAVAGAALFTLHHPLIFFASRPLAETVALALLLAALANLWRASAGGRRTALVGILAGAAALARPNLLLVPAAWFVLLAARGRGRDAAVLMAGVALAVLPVTLRNAAVSGHFVPVSANAGMTLYHGNGPGARGVFTQPSGFGPDGLQQREQATAVASRRSGITLDAVQADAWWGREAWRVRRDDPAGSAALLLRRVLLVVDNHEFSLDYPPALDPNPFRLTWHGSAGRDLALIPWALLLGLAATGAVLAGFRRSGGIWTWTALAACVATPLLFYVSSRYRLPTAALLSVPAGAGLAALLRAVRDGARREWAAGVLVLVGVAAVSLSVPSHDLRREVTARALANRALAFQRSGRLEPAARDARLAVAALPDAAHAHYTLGVVEAAMGRNTAAEAAFRRALELQPDLAEAAVAWARLMTAAQRHTEAEALLRRALRFNPRHAGCWRQLVANLLDAGEYEAAERAAEQARARGVALEAQPSPPGAER